MLRRIILVALLFPGQGFAQSTPNLIQNNNYWADGKAEYNIYDARVVRDGLPRPGEVLHILMREPVDQKQSIKPQDASESNPVTLLKLNQIIHLPAGLCAYDQMLSIFWRVDSAAFLKASLTSNDSTGNTFKQLRREGERFNYEYHTYSAGSADGKEDVALPPNSYFYDELPWVVRTLDFSKTPPEKFEIQLAGSIINSKKDAIIFRPAQIGFKLAEKSIEVSVEHAAGTDRFVLDRDGPHLLREWTAADGSHLKLKRNLKVDYWNYNKPGDRERALANPMLRLPD